MTIVVTAVVTNPEIIPAQSKDGAAPEKIKAPLAIEKAMLDVAATQAPLNSRASDPPYLSKLFSTSAHIYRLVNYRSRKARSIWSRIGWTR